MEKQPRNVFYLFNLSFVSAVKTLLDSLMPCFHHHVSVAVAKYVRITFICKNSVTYVNNNVLRFRKFAVAIHPFIYDRVLFFRTCRSYAPGDPPILLRGKLGPLPPGPAALLPHTRPGSNGRYGYGSGYVTVEISHYCCENAVKSHHIRIGPHRFFFR